jgi:hypothetical protein
MNPTEKLNKIRDESLAAAKIIIEAYSPQWKARVDVAKSLVPVTSAALVFTIAFAPSLAKPEVHYAWRYCLIGSWICFLCALTCSLLSLWFSISLHDLQANILEQSDKMRAAIANPSTNADDMLQVLGEIFLAANTPIERSDKMSRRLLNVAYVSYGIAILLIGILGARQLLVF